MSLFKYENVHLEVFVLVAFHFLCRDIEGRLEHAMSFEILRCMQNRTDESYENGPTKLPPLQAIYMFRLTAFKSLCAAMLTYAV